MLDRAAQRERRVGRAELDPNLRRAGVRDADVVGLGAAHRELAPGDEAALLESRIAPHLDEEHPITVARWPGRNQRYARGVRVALIVLLACIACGGHDDPPPKIKRVHRLEERDRGALVEIAGRASGILARTGSGAPHIRFELALADRSITVVTKDYVPDMFRDGVDVEVTGRWVHTADVRDALDQEGFRDVRGEDVLLAREVKLAPITFQF